MQRTIRPTLRRAQTTFPASALHLRLRHTSCPAVGASFADAAHQLSNNSSAFGDAAQQLSNNGSAFADARNSNMAPFADAAPGHAHDAALSPPVSSLNSNDDNDSGPTLANSDSFWFNADGPVHIGLGADDSVHWATDSFAAVSDTCRRQLRAKRRGGIHQRRARVHFSTAARAFSTPHPAERAPIRPMRSMPERAPYRSQTSRRVQPN